MATGRSARLVFFAVHHKKTSAGFPAEVFQIGVLNNL